MTVLTPGQSAFWERFRSETGETALPRGVDGFGDSEAMMDALLQLALIGRKQATATLARWFQGDPDALPQPGDLWLITDGRGDPACVIRTIQVDIMPVREVDADFAFDEGEGDLSLDYWLSEHRKFWRREAEREGFDYSDDLDVVCERFSLVWAPQD
ncbi:MAG: ASCH domain-containing protein [Pseudomonadota bacterium]